jgi:O-antigen ligase
MFLDLYNLGFQDFIFRSLVSNKIKLYGTDLYTGSVIFFISATLLAAMLLMGNIRNKNFKTLLYFIFSINIIILILANSRGLIIAAFLGVSLLSLTFKRILFLKILISFVFVFIILFFSVQEFQDLINLYFRTGTTHREIFWEAGLDMFKDYPFIGVGPHLFDKYFYNYAPSSVFAIQEWKIGSLTPHNFFLFYAAENGILGLFTGISLFVLFFYFASRVIKFSKKCDKQYFVLSIAILGIGIGFFVRSFFEVTGFLYYGYITTDLPFWLIFGILISIYQKYIVPNPNH